MRPPRASRGVALAIQAALCLAVHGCTAATGGAVELSWKLRGASGAGSASSFISCDQNGVLTNDKGVIEFVGQLDTIQIAWNVENLGSGSEQFRCSDGHGVTRFELPPGRASLTVSPICARGPAVPSSYTAPAPVIRDVTAGNIVSLGAVELVLQVDCSLPGTCICQ